LDLDEKTPTTGGFLLNYYLISFLFTTARRGLIVYSSYNTANDVIVFPPPRPPISNCIG
jgi:hypothetical protein